MDSLALVATVVVLAFIAWIVARNLGGRRNRDTGADASMGATGTWSVGGRRNDADHDGGTDAGHGGDAGGGDGGGGGD